MRGNWEESVVKLVGARVAAGLHVGSSSESGLDSVKSVHEESSQSDLRSSQGPPSSRLRRKFRSRERKGPRTRSWSS